MRVEFVNIGFGNVIAINRVVAIISPDTAPIKRMIQETRDKGNLVDVCYGRKTKAVLVLDSGHVILAPLQPETIVGRVVPKQGNGSE